MTVDIEQLFFILETIQNSLLILKP